MSATYEVWICDDRGQRKYLVEKFSSLSYSRTTHGFGTCQLILPYVKYFSAMGTLPRPDMRIDIWRSPYSGIPARREGSYLIRKVTIYRRTTDNVTMLELFGRSPLDILRRQAWRTNEPITDSIDNIMKTVVSGRFVTNLTAYSTSPNSFASGVYTSLGEFASDGNASDGPSITASFYLRNVLDILSDLKATSFSLNEIDPANKRIFFDLIEDESLVQNGFGYRFRTYPDLRGLDRTSGVVFSTENGNLQAPVYYEDYLDSVTSVFHFNSSATWLSQSAQSSDQYLSRWNYVESANTGSESDQAADLTRIYSELKEQKSKRVFTADFLNSPGSKNQPRSLYGVDWDMGDLLPTKFADQTFTSEVAIVYVGINDSGKETITGKTTVGSA